jgi:hypothetical protein
MPSVAREPLDQSTYPPLYNRAELIDLRRTMLLYARFFPPGPERNQHRQIAQSLGVLFRNKAWLDAHTREATPTRAHDGLWETGQSVSNIESDAACDGTFE